ncbi:MAG: endo-1,4-beta-xylanase [Planctomycetes bacterium]|nr:endo-1,4-beta-xylanase [Planctomycetota bacterium]
MRPSMFAVPLALALVAATAAAAQALTIEAEQARLRTAGAAMEGGWNLHSSGQVGDYVRVARPGTYTIVVRARGTPCGGEWPLMAVAVDNETGPTVKVESKEFADYTLAAAIPAAGVHVVAVAFLNDAVAAGEDRNLYLDRIEIRPPEGAEEPVPASPEEWARLGEVREEAALRTAAEGAEKHRKADATVRVVAGGKHVADAVVRADLVRHEFLFGANIYMFDRFKLPEQNATYKRRFRDLLNYATVGFYWQWYEPERGQPNYAYTDKVVAWCQEQGLRMKGHPLLWADAPGIPKWSNGQPAPDVQKARVREILGRYGDRITSWEVVNEPSHLPGLKIDDPYRWAREADPKATLVVNDYAVMADGQPPFFDLLRKAKADGVPYDGIGIQAHEPRTMRFPLEQVRRVLDRYATLGVGLHITEFTPCSGGQPITGSHRKGVWNEAAQAEYAERFYRVCFGHPAVVGITWWDLADQGAWLEGGGLLRKDLSPKPAYDALWRLIRREWKTKAEGRTDGTGAYGFRGVRGTYRVQVEFGGRKKEAEFVLAKDGPNTWTVNLDEQP